MAKRPRRAPRPAPPAVTATSACPCGLPAPYGECCGRFHTGTGGRPPTAELLMRSRYSAFVVGDEAYLLATWAPTTRPASAAADPDIRWTGLDIVATRDGTAFHTTGTVTFHAHHTDRGTPGVLREHSRFVRDDGAWAYLDGSFDDA